MSRGRAAVVALAVSLVAAVGVVLFVDRPEADVGGLRAVGDRPFGDGDELRVGATDAVLSADGGRLAVLTDDGLGLVADGAVRPVTQPGSKVVDVAWFGNGQTLLVAEGPVPTGALAVVDADGTVRGSVPLQPSVGFGAGYGMAVAPGGRRAVVTAVERPALAQEQRHLVLVDLETGGTRPLTEPGPAPEESGPYFVDRDLVAFTELGADGMPRPRLVDLRTGAVRELAGAATGTVVGVAHSSIVVHEGRRLLAVGAGGAGPAAPAPLGEIPRGTRVASVDGVAGAAVVVDRGGRLRRIDIERVGTS